MCSIAPVRTNEDLEAVLRSYIRGAGIVFLLFMGAYVLHKCGILTILAQSSKPKGKTHYNLLDHESGDFYQPIEEGELEEEE